MLSPMIEFSSAAPRGGRNLLLGCPREIRDMIYAFALRDIERLARRHDALCDFSSTELGVSETPPFIHQHKLRPARPCRCGKRQGLGLLLTCRFVQAEAALIFWAQNVFTFENTRVFYEAVGKTLRPECRSLLRHIIIYDHHGEVREMDDMHFYSRDAWDTIDVALSPLRNIYAPTWEILLQCTGLEILAIRPEVLMWREHLVQKLREVAPRFRQLKIVNVHYDEERIQLTKEPLYTVFQFTNIDIESTPNSIGQMLDTIWRWGPKLLQRMLESVFSWPQAPFFEPLSVMDLSHSGCCDCYTSLSVIVRVAKYSWEVLTTIVVLGLPPCPASLAAKERARVNAGIHPPEFENWEPDIYDMVANVSDDLPSETGTQDSDWDIDWGVTWKPLQ
ncbi:hypothetical protein F4780DRAFT_758395 [Xylariomycetidae sp. FL0641]|nr:hypothetical protein F4780DRAFT_758395 [Xylariomycetidae sp. FL0641]